MSSPHSSLWFQVGEAFEGIRISDILDMAVVSAIIYAVLLWFKRTKAAFVARGIMVLAVFYFVARRLDMVLTVWIFHGFFAIFLIALVVIFQEDLRHFFERVAIWRWRSTNVIPIQATYLEALVRSVLLLAREKVGALIVIKGKDPLGRHLEGGHELNGKLSSPLLESIFDPHSDGHDGAVIVEESIITRFGVHLPLSKNVDKVAGSGTRHAAALGLSEVVDALCIVVSEQKGTILLARDGNFHAIADKQELEKELGAFIQVQRIPEESSEFKGPYLSHLSEKAIAIAFAVLLWLVSVKRVKPLHDVVDLNLHTLGEQRHGK